VGPTHLVVAKAVAIVCSCAGSPCRPPARFPEVCNRGRTSRSLLIRAAQLGRAARHSRRNSCEAERRMRAILALFARESSKAIARPVRGYLRLQFSRLGGMHTINARPGLPDRIVQAEASCHNRQRSRGPKCCCHLRLHNMLCVVPLAVSGRAGTPLLGPLRSSRGRSQDLHSFSRRLLAAPTLFLWGVAVATLEDPCRFLQTAPGARPPPTHPADATSPPGQDPGGANRP